MYFDTLISEKTQTIMASTCTVFTQNGEFMYEKG